MNERQWIVEAVKYYRPLNFFAEFDALTDEQLTDELINRRIKAEQQDYWDCHRAAQAEADNEHEEWEVVAPAAIADMTLLSEDRNRIWWEDGEVDITPGGDIYVGFLQDCSRISRGAFVISNVEEEWDGEDLVGIDFDFNGERWQLRPDQMYGWIDFEVLQGMNSLIEDSGYQFYNLWTGDQTTYLVVLTEEEKQKLETERNWSFDDEAEDEEVD